MKRDSKLLAALALAFAAATQGGCTGPTKAADTANPHSMMAAGMMDQQLAPLEGKVVETMDAGGYTYVCLEKGGKKTWAAVPTMKVAVGDDLKLQPGAAMPNFTSKTLNRTFDSIIFSSGPMTEAKANPTQMPSGHPAITPGAASDKPASVEKTATTLLAGKVVETMDSGGYTYVCLEKDGKKGWAAVPTTKVNVGDEIELQPGMEMGKFTSKTLNKTFENIIFSSGIVKK